MFILYGVSNIILAENIGKVVKDIPQSERGTTCFDEKVTEQAVTPTVAIFPAPKT